MGAALWARRLTFALSVIAVLSCAAWFFMGMAFALTGTIMGVSIYVVGFGVTLTPMVAYWLAGLILHGERPARGAALWGILALLPVGALSLSFTAGYLAMLPEWTTIDAAAFACCAIPGAMFLGAVACFAALLRQSPETAR